LVVVCYVLGNVIVSFLWGVQAPFDTWRGVLRALLCLGVGLGLYFTAIGSFSFLEDRHAALPPIILSVAWATFIVLIYIFAAEQAAQLFQNGWEAVAVVVPPLGWAILGFRILRG
jgi:hypothetical protein